MPAIHPESEGFWMFLLSFIGSPSSELFLALSGTVLLPVKTGFGKFYSRRFLKLLPPLVVWSIFGCLLNVYVNGWTYAETWDKIWHIPLQPAIGVYWFVYAMIGLYLLAPFISPWLKIASKRQIEFFLLIWGINMVLPWILYFVPYLINDFNVNGNYYWELCYFGGFLGYWILGYYLNRYPIKCGFNAEFISICVLTLGYPIAIMMIHLNGENVECLMDNLQIGSVVFLVFLYTVLQNIRFHERIQAVLTRVAKYSFGIYLTHIYIARNLYWGIFDGSQIHIFPRTFLIAFLTLMTGYCLTWIISRVRLGKYVVGV